MSQMLLPSEPARASCPPWAAIPHGKAGGGLWHQGLASLGASPALLCSGLCLPHGARASSWGPRLLHGHHPALPARSRARKLLFKSEELLFKGPTRIPVQTSL